MRSFCVFPRFRVFLPVPVLTRFHPDKHLVPICIAFLVLLLIANLRGLKESGTIFAIPAYIFVAMCYLMIGLGLFGGYGASLAQTAARPGTWEGLAHRDRGSLKNASSRSLKNIDAP
jgi:amino acid transporter